MADLTPSPCYIFKWKAKRMPTPRKPVSRKQLAANRTNAAKSTGPRTPQGKARSAQNGRKHGFTASTFAIERRAQNRNHLLGEGFHRMVQQSNSWSLAIRYQAQAERHYHRAVEEFERLKTLRQELPTDFRRPTRTKGNHLTP